MRARRGRIYGGIWLGPIRIGGSVGRGGPRVSLGGMLGRLFVGGSAPVGRKHRRRTAR